MEMLDRYLKLQKEIFDYFGYAEDWHVFPIDDAREYFWRIEGGDTGTVCFAETEKELSEKDGQYYENEIYTQRHLPKWVYRGAEYTLIVVDTHTDGNKFLKIFSNSLERV